MSPLEIVQILRNAPITEVCTSGKNDKTYIFK